ncbi:tRNA-guanine transglycosylase [Candidatus Methanodesulfokora washburnensis]|jgi:tRNA-guanine family transglycosylase|uniref:tRNA-guanine transglycosylase n=1 Tax=Candidatus Methanodesulfokora washburnensis TaxID=2478471 RepID=A0A429GCK5_9CREN|nr:tRNA-guanine transglycosylase [Candidatus Methanodesulfokores washburnensis]RSN71493.1 tRNA-guanine transglycosylase [Candidatus Methanodesulfokores washburnensis]
MKIETPFLWFIQPIRATPKPWQFFHIDGVMLNAYEILRNEGAAKQVRSKGAHGFLKFNGLIAMDSGGFLFMKRDAININPEIILALYEESKPNFGVVLDHPLTPNLPQEIAERRMIKTLENTKRMVEARRTTNPELIPVIHGYDTSSIERYVKKLKEIGDFSIYGIGSLVPSVFNSKGVGGIYNVIEIVSFVRTLLPNKIIHVFGVGSTLTMHLMFYAGANSIDSSSWRSKAAFGAIQLPGLGDRYITPRKRHKTYPKLSMEEQRVLDECKCPACEREGLEGLRRSFVLRALHNAWVYQREIEKTRELIKSGEYEEYVKRVIGRTKVFSRALEVADKFKSKNTCKDLINGETTLQI